MFTTVIGLLALTPADPFGRTLPTKAVKVNDRYVVYVNDDLFASFQSTEETPPYVYPIFNHNQIPLTRNFPMRDGFPNEETDHPHHRSHWFTHGAINGVDFWHGEGQFKTTHLATSTEKNQTTIEYLGDLNHEGKTIAKAQFQITFSAWEIARAIDWQVTLSPAPGVDQLLFGDTKEGTMAIRTRPELRLTGEHAKGKAFNSEGVQGKDIWGKRAKWVTYWAPVQDKTIGLAIFDSPQNHAHPTWWQARDYGLIAANPFGKHDFEGGDPGQGDLTVKAGENLTLRYRFLFFDGEPNAKTLNRLYNDWAR